ncbi:MAG TPA: hypothetical protein VGJ79_06500 [Candidatus Dormibacteraeota bacterium]|jgi:hypothetical protein
MVENVPDAATLTTRWFNSRRLLLLVILNLIAVLSYVVVGWVSSYFAHVFTIVYSTPDARSYHVVGQWLLGSRPLPPESLMRPFFYPLLQELAARLGGTLGVWLLNVVLWFFALNVTAAATFRFVRSSWVAAFVFLALATNVSLILLTFHGLTETTVVALLAVWIYGLSHLTSRPTAAQVAWAVLPVSLLTVVKPAFEILLAVMFVVMLVGVIRSTERGLAAAVFAACLIPVAMQLALEAYFNGYSGLSTIGERTFRAYFLARLDVAIGDTHNIRVARAKMSGLNNFESARFALEHFKDSVRVFFYILRENLHEGTNFLPDRPRIRNALLIAVRAQFWVLIAMIPLVSVALWRARDGRLALLCAGILTIFLAGGLTFGQGDRITVVAFPLWLVALALAAREAGAVELWRALEARVRRPSTA